MRCREWQRRLERRGIVDIPNLSLGRELNRRVLAVEVVAIVDVMEGYRGLSKNGEMGRVGFLEAFRDMEGVDEYGCPAHDAVAQAVEELVPRGALEIPRRALNNAAD